MTDLRKAVEMSLEALDTLLAENNVANREYASKSSQALRQALSQPEQEWDSRHPKSQALIADRARLQIKLGIVEQLLEDPNFETMPSDMEYWEPLHDKLKEALSQPEQEPMAWMSQGGDVSRSKKYFEDMGFIDLIPLCTAPVDAVNMSQECVDEMAKRKHEPVWNVEECNQVIKTLRYIQGIAERGEGRAMRDDETLEQFVLGYVKKLEQPEQEPVGTYEGVMETMLSLRKGTFEQQQIYTHMKDKLLYTAPPKREWVSATHIEIGNLWAQHKEVYGFAIALDKLLQDKNR